MYLFSEYLFGWIHLILLQLIEVIQLRLPGSSSLHFTSTGFTDICATLANQPAEKWCDVYSVHISNDALWGCQL